VTSPRTVSSGSPRSVHPIQDRTDAEMIAIAEQAIEGIVAGLAEGS